MKVHTFLMPLLMSVWILTAQMGGYAAGSDIKSRKEYWATPIEKPGLPNFYKVSEALYRGAQPSAEGMQELKNMGIKTVVNLRTWHSDLGKLGDTGLESIHIPMIALYPKEEHVIRVLQLVTDKEYAPVFVHCKHGADRTGIIVASYRIVVEGWSKEKAIEEMTQGGFGFHSIWFNLIRFIEKLDVEGIRTKIGRK